MKLQPFKLERYFAKYEFNTEYLLSSSDCDGLYLSELLSFASPSSIKLWDELKLNYTESAGHPTLRDLIAKKGNNLLSDNVIIAAPEELIYIVINTRLKPGDHIIALTPTYQSLYSLALDMGCEISNWNLEEYNGKWHLDIDQLEELIRINTKLIVVNFPNNPTGYLPNLNEFNKIIEVAEKFGITLFSDEMYRLMEYQQNQRLPSAAEIYPKAIALSGLSKSFALPGLRIGWLTTQNKSWIESFIKFKDFTTICNSAPSEILAIIALENQNHIIERNLSIIRENLAFAREFFKKHHRWFYWIEPTAGSICFPRWLDKKPIEEFCEDLVAEHGIMIVPGSMFDWQEPNFRLGLGRKNFIQGLKILDSVMDNYG